MNDEVTTYDDIRIPLTSADVTAERLEKLKELLPEAFTEGKVDFARLRQALGDVVETGRERYGLSWAGKADAIRAIQTPSVGTLIPVPQESVNFETTENLIIEGENLEVLKLLQKSYHGKVKMIYIDPPYNTGNEFIYPDDYRDPLKQYLRLTGQVSKEGIRLTTNTETSGRYHSNWLSMMYPRLFLARSLLRDDGVIFVSIDDHEVHNLRLLVDEIFGPENYIASFVRRRRMASGMRDDPVSPDHEYVITYARSKDNVVLYGLPKREEDYPYEDEKGKYRSTDLTVGMTKTMRPNQWYQIRHPRSGKEYWPPENRVWRFHPSTMQRHIKDSNIIWPDDRPDSRMTRPRFKTRYEPREQVNQTSPVSTWIAVSSHEMEEEDVYVLQAGLNQEATRELRELLGEQVLDYPKPLSLLKALLQLSTRDDDLVLDFFAGSGTTGDAILLLNREDGGSRRFVLVQLPERVESGSTAAQAGFKDIAGITRARVRARIEKLRQEPLELGGEDRLRSNLGFRVMRLAPSNFKIWEGEKAPQDAEGLAEQLKLYADHVLEGHSRQDILYELILKAGLPLTAKIEEKAVVGKTVYSADGLVLICLEDEVTVELLRGMSELKPQQIICLDRAFRGNDQLKTNTVLEMKQRKITFHTV